MIAATCLCRFVMQSREDWAVSRGGVVSGGEMNTGLAGQKWVVDPGTRVELLPRGLTRRAGTCCRRVASHLVSGPYSDCLVGPGGTEQRAR